MLPKGRHCLFTWVAFVSHIQTLRARPVDQVEVNVTQIQLRQAAQGSFHGFLALILWAQLTVEAKRERAVQNFGPHLFRHKLD